MNQIDFSCRKFHITSMTGFLKNRVRIIVFRFQMIRILSFIRFSRYTCHNRVLRIFFIWSPDVFGTSHGHTVIVSCATLSTHDIIIVSTLCQMRSFHAASVCAAFPYDLRISYDLLLFRRILHHADVAWLFISFPWLPFQ